MMTFMQRKAIELIAKIVPTFTKRWRMRLNDQPMKPAGLVRQIARREIDLVVADRHCLGIGVSR